MTIFLFLRYDRFRKGVTTGANRRHFQLLRAWEISK